MIAMKKMILAPLAIAAVVGSMHAAAADPFEHTIMLQATVPTNTFHVLPQDSSWIGNVQTLNYNAITQELSSLSKPFDVLHTTGAINAHLISSATLSSPNSNIALVVKFNNVALSTTSTQVLTPAEAAAPRVAMLEIIPTKPGSGYAPGKYSGNVSISFDAVI